MARPGQSVNASTRWIVWLMPLFIIAIFALAIYIIVARLCIDYLYREKHQTGVAAVFLALFFLFLVLTLASYTRTFFAIQRDPGLVPLPPTAPEAEADADALNKAARERRRRRGRLVEEGVWAPPDPSPDSPGLESFYSKDVFVCEADGRPRWCSACRHWKPDRAHHSSELGRCVRKMDHFCPWVGGMVSETSFNFFTQFTIHCTLFCAISFIIAIYSLHQQSSDGRSLSGWTLAPAILASIFGSFACGLAINSLRFVLVNITNIDVVRRAHGVTLAVRIPRTTPPTGSYHTIVYPLPRPVSQTGAHEGLHMPPSVRDQQAERKFAVVRTQGRENPWDLGFRENWRSVMGERVVDWLLPIRPSPCCNHESMESDYKYGKLVSQLRKRYNLPDIHISRGNDGIEMQTARKERSH